MVLPELAGGPVVIAARDKNRPPRGEAAANELTVTLRQPAPFQPQIGRLRRIPPIVQRVVHLVDRNIGKGCGQLVADLLPMADHGINIVWVYLTPDQQKQGLWQKRRAQACREVRHCSIGRADKDRIGPLSAFILGRDPAGGQWPIVAA
eukprot:GHVR01064418.1.p2 GENE.GHVR01064418.1~~GHVR01064418.1.p2  ORF type:complete len:149 (+),score=15.94 GHVR01064418.1:535-981(+)